MADGILKSARVIGTIAAYPSVGDFNNDGFIEPFGLLNNGDGTFSASPSVSINAITALYPGRKYRSEAVLDIDGDGNLDVVWNVYDNPGAPNSFTLILYGDGTGGFSRHEERRDADGFGETITVADFNNDGLSDVYITRYTHVPGSDSNHLLLNEGGQLGPNRAEEWGAELGNLPVFFRVEGAQAVDLNFDGKIDLYAGSHFFINDGTKFATTALDPYLFEEGASFIDYDNDGDFDLVLRDDEGAPRLLKNDAGNYVDLGHLAQDISSGDGVKVLDIDGNGWEDIVFGSDIGLTVLLNTNGAFERHDLVDVPYSGSYSFFDYDNDGRFDLLNVTNTSVTLVENNLPKGNTFSLTVLGANGELNQHGRSILITSLTDPSLVMARSVEGGSGYLSQGQYSLLVGLPAAGAYQVSIAFASGSYSFIAAKGQEISAFNDGRVSIAGSADADTMGGGAGADVLAGNDGDDVFLASGGADSIDGGNGLDTLDFTSFGSGAAVDLGAGTIAHGATGQSVQNVENVLGSAFADALTGDGLVNQLFGGDGDDSLDGGGGGDRLAGGVGNDIYIVRTGDLVVEAAGEGMDEVRTELASYTLADEVEELTGTSDAGQVLTGNGLDNLLSGASGADILAGAAGDDVYLVGDGDTVIETAGGGMDEVRTGIASYLLADEVENLIGTSADGQALTGNAQANRIEGGSGADTLSGGQGDDRYIVGFGDSVLEYADEGVDEVLTALANYTLSDFVENLSGTSATAQTLIGNALDNRLSGGTAGDVMRGGAGNDTYLVQRGDQVVEDADEGTDHVITDLAVYTLSSGVENLTGTAARGQKLVGNAAANTIRGGQDTDTLIGGAGNDIYFASGIDYIYEFAGEGSDTVRATGSYFLYFGQEIERIEAEDALSTIAMSLGGNEFVNTVVGNAGSNFLDGGGGADILQGFAGDDTYAVDDAADVVLEIGDQGNDLIATTASYVLASGVSVETLYAREISQTIPLSLTGNELANTVRGNAGANFIDGGAGADLLQGFGGDDTYAVDQAADLVVEEADGGYDRVATYVSYQLSAGSSIELLYARDVTLTTGIALIGNELANTVRGNAGGNYLDGGAGIDTLQGFAGDDVYAVDDARDVVLEAAGAGNDRVATYVSYQLRAGSSIELLYARDLTLTTAISLTGNELANTVQGNAGANFIDGGAGADLLQGFGGDDTYAVDQAADLVIEEADGGYDRVATYVSYQLSAGSSVELLYARDVMLTTAISLTGNELANTVRGNRGDNIIDGGAGADILQGFDGSDTFQFSSGGNDRIVDFEVGIDRIALSNDVFAALLPGNLAAEAFQMGAVADSSSDRVLYDPSTGALYYDADGSGGGAAIQFATLQAQLSTLSAADFVIY